MKNHSNIYIIIKEQLQKVALKGTISLGDEKEQFRTDSGVSQWSIMSPWLFTIYIYIYRVMKEVKMGMERRRVIFLEDGREIAWLFVCS